MFLILDVETTGLPRYDLPADDPSQPRVAAVAMILCDEALNQTAAIEHLIKPDGWVMEPGAMAVNGLTMERLEIEGVPIAVPLEIYAAALDQSHIVVAHNTRFDCKMMRVDVPTGTAAPLLGEPEAFETFIYGGGSIFSVVPMTEEACRKAGERDRPRPYTPIARLPEPSGFDDDGDESEE